MLLPFAASAHEHRTFQIGDKQYVITIGSMNEPVRVGDKSGVEFEVMQPAEAEHEGAEHDDAEEHEGTPVTGLETTLKVEVAAGDQTKVFDLRPTWGTPGGYNAVFYPTMETTYTYRLMGTINGIDVDLSFPCNPTGGEAAADDMSEKQISEGVTQLTHEGGFGCPAARADVEFPATTQFHETSPLVMVSLALGALGTAFGLAAMRKKSCTC